MYLYLLPVIVLFLLDKSIFLDYNSRRMIYDRFQQEAIDYINQGYSVIVSAPTGAGKTVIAEHVINESSRKIKTICEGDFLERKNKRNHPRDKS